MLSKKNRLTKKKDFEKVFKKGKAHYTKVLGIKTLKNDLPDSRFGIVISTKIAKKVFRRNLVKRRLREIIRNHLSEINSSYDFIILTLPPVVEKSFQELDSEVMLILKKLRAIK